MKIIIKPSDIVKRGLWNSYVYYYIRNEKKAEELLKEDKEFELDEHTALVIGLLKVIETDNLIHRFNDHILYVLNTRSTRELDDNEKNDKVLIKKKVLEYSVEKFLLNFPSYWDNIPDNYKYGLKEMKEYVQNFLNELNKLPVQKTNVQNIVYEMVNSNSVKKILNRNN